MTQVRSHKGEAKKLTPKEEEFVNLYCHSMDLKVRANAFQCYKKAFGLDKLPPEEFEHKKNKVYQYAYELVTSAHVKAAITAETELIDQNWVKQRLEIEVHAPDAKPSDRIRATELLGKTHAMFVDTVQGEMAINTVFDPENEEK